MTHYDPRDWEPDDDPPGPHWLSAIAAALLILILSFAVYRIAEAREFLILDEQGDVIARCEYPIQARYVEGGMECRTPRLIFANGFES